MNRRQACAGLLLLTIAFASGCVQRKMVISTDPPGAVVTVNQTWRMKTPCTLPFKHYGTYDIQIEKDGYYPLNAKEPIAAPFHQQPGVDVVTDVLLPARIKDVRKLHYKLEKIDDPDDIEGILARARELREKSGRISKRRQKRDEKRRPKALPLPTKKKEEGKASDKKDGTPPTKEGPSEEAGPAGIDPELGTK